MIVLVFIEVDNHASAPDLQLRDRHNESSANISNLKDIINNESIEIDERNKDSSANARNNNETDNDSLRCSLSSAHCLVRL